MTKAISPEEFLEKRPPISSLVNEVIDFFNRRLQSGDPERVQMHVRTVDNNRILKVITHISTELFPIDPTLYVPIQDAFMVSGWARCVITQFAQEGDVAHTVIMLEQDNPITKK